VFQDTQPAALGTHGSLDAWVGFRVDDPAEGLRLLKQLRDGSVAVSLSAPQGSAVTSQLWSVDPVRAQVSFSVDADSVHVQCLTQCDEAVAVAYLDSVKLQFDLVDLLLVRGAQACTLRARLPDVLYRFQRRSSYRVRTFERHAPKASLRHPSMPDMRLNLRIIDISVGGCALGLPDDVPALQPGSSLCGVRIELDADTVFNATLRLQHVSAMQGGRSGQRLGCEFVELDGGAQRALQRYIDHTQQRRRLLASR
jgi:c-di-GMP-binding flagellar brake protein YcgR